MDTREWALLIFTILAQLAVGMLLVSLVVRAYAVKKLGVEQAAKLLELPTFSLVPVMGLALIASLFHLGKVTHVIGAVPNLGTSWMSREVVFAVVFAVAAAVYTFLYWRKSGTETLRSVWGWVTAVIGLALIFSMSMTYMLPAQPAFNTFATPVTFFSAMLLLGVLGFATMLMVGYGRMQNKQAALEPVVGKSLQWIGLAALVLLGVELLVMPVYMAYLSTQGSAALKSLNLMVGAYGPVLVVRLVLVFIGAGVLAAYIFSKAQVVDLEKVLTAYVYGAFALVLLSEVLGRFLFYATQYRIGI
jgi:anaerobic dimethyl sulfoxide reductase subunit C (anchor subunit)